MELIDASRHVAYVELVRQIFFVNILIVEYVHPEIKEEGKPQILGS